MIVFRERKLQKLSMSRQGNLDKVITKDYPSRQAWWHLPVTLVPVKGHTYT